MHALAVKYIPEHPVQIICFECRLLPSEVDRVWIGASDQLSEGQNFALYIIARCSEAIECGLAVHVAIGATTAYLLPMPLFHQISHSFHNCIFYQNVLNALKQE